MGNGQKINAKILKSKKSILHCKMDFFVGMTARNLYM